MKGALDESGSESRHDGEIAPFAVDDQDTHAGTVSYVPSVQSLGGGSAVDENEPTIISQRPVAAPEEFYRSMPLPELAAMLEGKKLDHFVVEQIIGGGGMGAVFRGRDERLDRTVAIKVIPASKRDPETLRRFRLEAQAAARLDHPNIARVYYVGEADQWNYIVFEFIDGVNIRDLVAMEGPLSVDDAVYYTRQIAEALQHAHDRNVVHRDIKPSNLLVTAGGVAKIVDMGLARDRSMDKSTADATASGITLGTFDYISPEQARDPRDADVRSDLYSLGCSLFFMLTGNPPFPQGTALQKLLNHGSLPPPDPRGWRDDLSDQMYAIIMKMMAKQPSDRYQRPLDLVNDLMLLAKVEDLPKSQAPGSILFTPSVAQRSLLESNLPWMVAFAFLLGSTLWLQTVQSMSKGFELPGIDFSRLSNVDENASTVEAPAETAPAAIPNGIPPSAPEVVADSARAAAESSLVPKSMLAPKLGRIVVSPYRPEGVSPQYWYKSLREAIEQTDVSPIEIELRGRQVLDQSLYVSGRDITIRGPAGNRDSLSERALVQVAPELLSGLNEWSGAIELNDASLDLLGVDFQVAIGGMDVRDNVGIVRLAGGSSVSLQQCTLTVSGDSPAGRNFYALMGDDNFLRDFADSFSSQRETSLLVSLDESIVRGNASLFGLRVGSEGSHRVEVRLTNSLVTIGGAVVDALYSASYESSPLRSIRMFCEQSTFLTGRGFAVLSTLGSNQPLLNLTRTSNNCVYDTGKEFAHFVIRGLNQESFLGSLNSLVLKGFENVYGSKVNVLCKCYDPDNFEIYSFEFNEAEEDGWFKERANESQIRWLTPRDLTKNLSELAPSDLRVQKGIVFSPGFLGSDKLPSF